MRAYEVRFRTYFDRRAPLVVHVEPHREAVTKTPVPGHALRALHSGRGRSLRKQAGGYGLSPTNSPSSREIIASPDPSGKSLRFIRRCARLSQALLRKIFLFRFSERCDHLPASRCQQEGRRDRHDVGSGERWTRGACVRRAQIRRGRPKRVVLSPRRWGQVCFAITRAGDGG